FTKTNLHTLLTNVTYLGKVKYKDEVHDGEHRGIVEGDVWQQVQDRLRQNGRGTSGRARCKSTALLRGLLRCRACGCAMTPTHAYKSGGTKPRYYVCLNAVRCGGQACPSPSLPAAAIEALVLTQLRTLSQDPAMAGAALAPLADAQSWEMLPADEQARWLRC